MHPFNKHVCMKILMLVLFSFCSAFAYSQSDTIFIRKGNLPKIPGYKDSMPNALSGISITQKKVGNNLLGFDVYESNPDNMPVLKPDSSFYSPMPNAITPNAKNKVLLQQMLEKKSLNDLQLMKPYQFKLIKPLPQNKLGLIDTIGSK